VTLTRLHSSKKNIYLIGLNHDTAPLAIRERLAFDKGILSTSCNDLRDQPGVDEALILSTCNRTEIYCYSDDPTVISHWLSETKDVPLETLMSHVYIQSSEDVLAHAARVASGIESLVVGETQIFGQMKVAYQQSKESSCLGKVLRKLFDTAFSIAKDVRSSTSIGAYSISMASASLRTIDRIFPNLFDQRVLFIGAGEMINLFSQHFSAKKFKSLMFCNRTTKHALELASKYGGDATELGNIGDHLEHFDIIVSCTASPVPILGKGLIEDSLRKRRHKPIMIFDLAVPRDIEASVAFLDDVFLFTVDDLGDLIRQGMEGRQAALDEANAIIARRVSQFSELNVSDGSVETVKAFRQYGAGLAQEELRKALDALKRSDDPEEVLRSFTNALAKKFLDRPSRALNSARGDDREKLSDALSKLFNLDNQT
jgi:glutamyl-tRNA reductase